MTTAKETPASNGVRKFRLVPIDLDTGDEVASNDADSFFTLPENTPLSNQQVVDQLIPEVFPPGKQRDRATQLYLLGLSYDCWIATDGTIMYR